MSEHAGEDLVGIEHEALDRLRRAGRDGNRRVEHRRTYCRSGSRSVEAADQARHPGRPVRVRVDLNHCGGWDIAFPGRRDRVTCETLDEARRVAYLCAAHRHSCELVVCDADHSVMHREFIDGDDEAASARSRG